MPERSTAISGEDAKGPTPIAAERPDGVVPVGNGEPVPTPPKPVVPPAVPVGVLAHLADR